MNLEERIPYKIKQHGFAYEEHESNLWTAMEIRIFIGQYISLITGGTAVEKEQGKVTEYDEYQRDREFIKGGIE